VVKKLAYIVPGIGLREEEISRRAAIANKIVERDVTVDIITVNAGPKSIETRIEEAYASVSYLPKLYSLSQSYDGFIIGCFGDPGVRAARELVDKPVVGPAESTLHVAAQLADKFTIISPLKTTVKLISDVVKLYGFENRVEAIVPVEIPVLDIINKPEVLANRILDVVSRSKGEAIILGCMSMGFALIDEILRTKLEIPILNPVKISLKTAELMVKLALSHSPLTYPRVQVDKISHLL